MARAELGGGVILTLSHEIDYLYWLFGGVADVTAVTARAKNLEMKPESIAEIALRFKNGILGQVHLDCIRRTPQRGCEIVGTEGTIFLDLIESELRISLAGSKPPEVLKAPLANSNQTYFDEMKDFLMAVEGSRQPLIPLSEGIRCAAGCSCGASSRGDGRQTRMPIKRPYTIGLICARGGSEGVHRKNLRLLAGKPLIGWAIEVARKCPSLDRVVVSTEDAEIAEVAKRFGAEVPFVRPQELAEDNSPELAVWQHALRILATEERGLPEVMVNIPTTSPMRAVEDVENCITELLKFHADLCLTVREAQRNPYFNMVKMDDGWASLVITSPTATFRRQDAPAVYDITTVAYALRSEYVLSASRLLRRKSARGSRSGRASAGH